MDTIVKQVRRARWRLICQQLCGALMWSLFFAFLLAAIIVGVDRFWPLGVPAWVWLAAAAAAGLLVAIAWSLIRRRTDLDAALELDRRFGLRERVSSSLALSAADRETRVGRALLEDAEQRVKRVRVGDGFTLRVRPWQPILAVAPAAIALLLIFFVEQVVPENAEAASSANIEERKLVQIESQALKKKVARQRRAAIENGLKDLETLLEKVEREMEKLSKADDADKKKALLKLSDLANDLKRRRSELGGVDQLRRQLQRLKDRQGGPARDMAKAMRDADFEKAAAEAKKLQQILEGGKMNEQQRKKLADQLNAMKDQMDQIEQARQQAEQQLKDKIEQAKQEGREKEAGDLQKQLDKLQQQSKQMDKLQDLAKKMGQCSKCAGGGDQAGAAQAMQDLANTLKEMDLDAQTADMLDEVSDQLAQAQEALGQGGQQGEGQSKAGDQGQGQGQARGPGQGDNEDGKPGDGLGAGRGAGARPETEDDGTGFRDSQQRMRVRRGRIVIVGRADGPNIKGKLQDAIGAEVKQFKQGTENPITERSLNRQQREHAQQYFDAVRDGK